MLLSVTLTEKQEDAMSCCVSHRSRIFRPGDPVGKDRACAILYIANNTISLGLLTKYHKYACQSW